MKLQKLAKRKRNKIIVVIIMLISGTICYLLGKTFAMYQVSKSFEFVNGKVNYYGHSDVYFAFYNGDTWLEEMPKKGNSENLEFEKAMCDNNTTISWNSETWEPTIKNLTKAKTRCTLYFAKLIHLDRDITLAKEGADGLYKVEHSNLTSLGSGWNKTEYRYAGVNPDNYVSFNNELWRIIGLVNVQTNNGVEQRVKIIRTNGISGQKDFGNYAWDRQSGYTNNWVTSKLKDMLNGIYYNSGTGTCYTGSNGSTASQSNCDFSGNSSTYPKGLDDTARKMVDSEVIWNIGGWSTERITADTFYEKERGTTTNKNNTAPNTWTTSSDGTYHKGIGLMYPSDYGYATNGGEKGRDGCFEEVLRNWSTGEYKTECANNDWLKPSSGYNWTLSPYSSSSDLVFHVYSSGYVGYGNVGYASGVWATAYLKSSVKITDGTGASSSPYTLS